MKLKCIGGVCDGEYWESNHFRLGDVVQVYKYPKETALDFYRNIDECIKATSIPIYPYVVRLLRMDKREYKYLTPVDENEFDCLIKQLEK